MLTSCILFVSFSLMWTIFFAGIVAVSRNLMRGESPHSVESPKLTPSPPSNVAQNIHQVRIVCLNIPKRSRLTISINFSCSYSNSCRCLSFSGECWGYNVFLSNDSVGRSSSRSCSHGNGSRRNRRGHKPFGKSNKQFNCYRFIVVIVASQ